MEQAASSNTEAMSLVKQQKPAEGTIVWVLNQTQGRGQGKKVWYSNANENLTFSIILYPDFLQLEHQFLLSKTIASAVCKTVSLFCEECFIKWPNDIYVKNNKIAGILIENIIQKNKMAASIVGIGININQTEFNSTIPNPTSLRNETGKIFQLPELLELLQNNILSEYNSLKMHQYDSINEYYDSKLYYKNKLILAKINNKRVQILIKEVDQEGYLHAIIDEKEHLFAVGEIELLIASDYRFD